MQGESHPAKLIKNRDRKGSVPAALLGLLRDRAVTLIGCGGLTTECLRDPEFSNT
ncbi:hypothetical protein BAUCODRAFT_34489, partial [Baudoinia panamericana UAMH 10762]